MRPSPEAAGMQSNILVPSADPGNWVDWAETSTGNIGFLSSTWQVPSNPSFDSDSDVNLIWNGIQPPSGNGILQPVTGFNYKDNFPIQPENNRSRWANRWTGNVWHGYNGVYYQTQSPINLNAGDRVLGTVTRLPWDTGRWHVTLSDLSAGSVVTDQISLTASFPPDSVQAVNAFEAYPFYINSPLNANEQPQYHWYPSIRERYTDTMKPSSDVSFSNLILNTNFLPVSLPWSEQYSLGHPTVKNLDIDISNGYLSTVQMHMNSASKPSHAITPVENPPGEGIISPNETINVPYDYSGSIPFAIIPDGGYQIDNVIVDGSSKGPVTSYTFSNDHADHTITANFKPVSNPMRWDWSTDGWGDWQHSWSVSGTEVGPNSEYGPVIVNDPVEGIHGEHGTDTNLLAGSTQSWVWKTFTDPSGTGWNTITFNGLMTASDVPGGRWMTIDINGNEVFGGTASQSPPGNGVPFEITESFPQSSSVTVKISNGQNPAWGPRFAMHYYNITMSRQNTLQSVKSQALSAKSLFTIPDGSEWKGNETISTGSQ
jgi:hypothetical protein